MHKLVRGSAPQCLSRYNYRAHDLWRDLNYQDRIEVWVSLELMQGKRCAYCESVISRREKSHIEHFRQRSEYPKGIFEWSNLFGSCDRSDSCGTYKDKQIYNAEDLIKMDEEDPEDYLRFLPDGQVVAADKLSDVDKYRAQETIRIFNLNGPLRRTRESHVQGYIQTAEELVELAAYCSLEEWQEMLAAEIRAVDGHPYETAIRHLLQFASET